MDLNGIPPPVMNWKASNLPEQWEKFQLHVELIFSGPLKNKNEPEKVSYLLLWIGEEGRQIYKTWTGISQTDAGKLETYYARFKNHVQPKLNPIFARYRFNNETQGSDSIDSFVTRLRTRARDCNFAEQDNMIRDRIMFGCSNAKVRAKLIDEGEKLTMDKAIQIAQNYAYCQQQLSSMTISSPSNVDAIKRWSKPGRRQPKQIKEQQMQPNKHCGNCGTIHKKDKCPAYGKVCHDCKKMNHYSKMCRSKKTVHELETCGATGHDVNFYNKDYTDYSIDTVSATGTSSPDRAFATLLLGPTKESISFKVDTGSAVNILPFSRLAQLRLKQPLEASQQKLTSYTGNLLPVQGTITLDCSYKGKVIQALFYVVGNSATPLIGLQSSLDLSLLKLTYSVESTPCSAPLSKQSVQHEYAELFNGVGVLPGTCKLYLKENAITVVNPPRRVPEALKTKFKDELDRMEKDSIIARVTQPTDWVNSVVLVEKPATNKLRVCLDPKALNESIRRPHYQMPTLDDVVSQLSGAKTFSKLDITHAYWSIKLDDESSYLTTFSTPFGRYRYLRLPFGISASSDLFQQKMDEICEGLTGVKAIVDDILCYGRSTQEHDENLRKLLERAREKGVRFNPEKCTIGVHEVPFFGHVISDQGLKADPSKIEAIVNLEPPDSKEKLETLLGMANYMSKFAPRLADITAPLRVLLQDKVAFIWDTPQQQAFEEVKYVITNSPALGFHDPSKPLTLESDASKNGLGSCLMQNDRPIAYASKSLTKTEQGYAQIEKELLAILFGCKRFHQYTYGRPIRVHTDHKPIVSIMKKPLSAASPRLQRMLLQLQNYNLDVHYVRGTDIPVSDFLSRHSLTDTHPKLIEGLDLHVHAIKQQLFVTDSRLDSIRTAIKNDIKMQKLKQTIACGWPDLRAECDPGILDFWNHRDELSFEDDLIFRGQKLLIPHALRQEMISKVHTGHLGVSKTLERAKDNLFWPGMSKDITEHVLQCAICLKHRDSNAKEPLIPHEFPDRPYQKIGVDLFHFDGKEHLLTVDYYSRFFEIDFLPDTRAATVIQKLKVHLSRNGLVDICVTDNGPQFSSELFRDFANKWGFEHKTSSPLHPMCNGLAEKSVGIAKKLLTKAKESNQDPYIALLEYRNTPLLDCNMSPAQLLYSRRTKSIVPITNKLLQHQPVNQSTVQKNMQRAKATQKAKFDKSAKPLPPLSINESVRIQAGKFWRPAKVMKKHDTRSYTVQTKDGALYRRNRKHLMKTAENFSDFAFNPSSVVLPHSENSISLKRPLLPSPLAPPLTLTEFLQTSIPTHLMLHGLEER